MNSKLSYINIWLLIHKLILSITEILQKRFDGQQTAKFGKGLSAFIIFTFSTLWPFTTNANNHSLHRVKLWTACMTNLYGLASSASTRFLVVIISWMCQSHTFPFGRGDHAFGTSVGGLITLGARGYFFFASEASEQRCLLNQRSDWYSLLQYVNGPLEPGCGLIGVNDNL